MVQIFMTGVIAPERLAEQVVLCTSQDSFSWCYVILVEIVPGRADLSATTLKPKSCHTIA